MRRRDWLRFSLASPLLLLESGCSERSGQPALAAGWAAGPQESLRRAARYLWERQAPDGGWHSQTYGLLRSGQSLTPFVLEALLRVPPDVYGPATGPMDRAIAFLLRGVNGEGAVGRMDPGLEDYPTYATSLAARILRRALRNAAPSIGYLRRQQFSEENGWKPKDPAYGAWGMGGEPRRPPEPGHVDLSMTRHALQALAEAGVPPGDPAFRRARVFVERCQNYAPERPEAADGGFCFSTVVLDANKAGRDGARFRSYGTATADGILCLLASGCSPRDERVRAAARWLAAHHRPDGAPGFAGEAYQRWTRGLRFYYAAASAEAFRRVGIAGAASLAEGLIRTQRPDGSWLNEESLVKEDDPLIATGFAVRALESA